MLFIFFFPPALRRLGLRCRFFVSEQGSGWAFRTLLHRCCWHVNGEDDVIVLLIGMTSLDINH